MNGRNLIVVAVFVCCVVTLLAAQEAPAPAGQTDHAAAIKQSLQTSMATLRQYQWVETTVVSVKGEEKSRTQSNCQYGADGKVMKTPIGEQQESSGKKPRGIRGKSRREEDGGDERLDERGGRSDQAVRSARSGAHRCGEAGRKTVRHSARPEGDGQARHPGLPENG